MSSFPIVSGPEGDGIAVAPVEPLQLDTAEYAWLQESCLEVPVVAVTLMDGTEFRYGSLVGFSNAVRKIAGNVSEAESATTQEHLFAALPAILKGERHPGIGKVENSRSQDKTLFSASRNITKAVRLVFAVEQPDDSIQLPTVLRTGISIPNDHNKLMRALGVVQIGHGGHRKTRRA